MPSHLDVVVNADPCHLPFGVLVTVFRQRAKRRTIQLKKRAQTATWQLLEGARVEIDQQVRYRAVELGQAEEPLVATIESIGSSTRIEGSKLSDREVERLLSNLQIKNFTSRDEQEVAGYAEVMELVFSSWKDITFTENHIKQLHQNLLVYSEKDAWHRGNYKTTFNSVAAFDENSAQIGIVFQTATPFDTPRLMTELVTWVQQERAAGHLHPLLIIALWVVVFLEIHPFQDGNGRLSRVLTENH